ncbi:YgaP-like transmembrane domain [Tabrizicola sp.]|uniref:YgaP-like transmembrane domain n=1 Tax=Tabrizicola sp. TaxID=2005166 RepID=UPI0025E5742C|nr:YgaP-like transmembrane domain [Tabrizicola sp.]
MLPATTDRVPDQTEPKVNEQLRKAYEERIAEYAAHPDRIDERLTELDREWDIERAIEANAATLAFAGVALGATTDRRWLVLPALVAGFLLQHALQGWCPPVPILRSMGFRTAAEIDRERYALKVLRGDFVGVATRKASVKNRAAAAISAVEG